MWGVIGKWPLKGTEDPDVKFYLHVNRGQIWWSPTPAYPWPTLDHAHEMLDEVWTRTKGMVPFEVDQTVGWDWGSVAPEKAPETFSKESAMDSRCGPCIKEIHFIQSLLKTSLEALSASPRVSRDKISAALAASERAIEALKTNFNDSSPGVSPDDKLFDD